MSRQISLKNNSLIGGLSIAENLYAKPDDFDEIFERIEKPAEVVPVPRATFIRSGVLTTSKGSAYMEYGNTKILAQVSAPRELTKSVKRTPLGVINCYVNFAAFGTNDLKSVPMREKHMSSALKKALEPMICRNEFANFQIDIRALVLDDDGCVLSTAINCCGLALVEYGISTYDLVVASTACIYRGVTFVNPNAEVEQLLSNDCERIHADAEHGIVVTATMPAFEQVASCSQSGFMTPGTYLRLLDYTVAINRELTDTISHVLKERVREQHKIALVDQAEDAREDARLQEVIKKLQQSGLLVGGKIKVESRDDS